MSATDIEKRLTALEREIARMKGGRAPAEEPHPIQALERIHGAFENDDAFQEAMRLGRRWREGQRPQARKAKRK